MHLLIGIAVVSVLVAAYIIASVSRLRENSAAMEQVSRELLIRLQNIEGKLADTEKEINEELALMKKEQRDEARAAAKNSPGGSHPSEMPRPRG